MITEWFYDRNDEAKIFLDEDKFYSKNGEVIGYLEEHGVYSPVGEFICFYSRGILYDSDMRSVAFTESAKGFIPELDEIIGSPGQPDFSDFEDDKKDYSPETGLVNPSQHKNGIGHSGEPLHLVTGGWSDETLDDLFGVKL